MCDVTTRCQALGVFSENYRKRVILSTLNVNVSGSEAIFRWKFRPRSVSVPHYKMTYSRFGFAFQLKVRSLCSQLVIAYFLLGRSVSRGPPAKMWVSPVSRAQWIGQFSTANFVLGD